MSIQTWPSTEELDEYAARVPEFMRPNLQPYAAWYEGLLSDEDCDKIIEKMMLLEPYDVEGCGATTRECEGDEVLNVIEWTARGLNSVFWGYDLDPGQHSWMQTYEKDGKYQAHMDGSPGQTRKLTAVALLSHSRDYQGGDLVVEVPPRDLWVPRTRGTVVVFLPWMTHRVQPVTGGLRQTINMGFWGPPFK